MDKECLPAHFNGLWQPHITLTAPFIAIYGCLGLAADLAFRKAPGADVALLGCLYAAALGAAWGCWPPAFIRGNRVHAAADTAGNPRHSAAVQSVLCNLDVVLMAWHPVTVYWSSHAMPCHALIHPCWNIRQLPLSAF